MTAGLPASATGAVVGARSSGPHRGRQPRGPRGQAGMSTAVARKRSNPYTAVGPSSVVHPTSPSEIAQVLADARRYPSPIRPVGSGSSTTRCTTTNGGTLVDLSEMNRVLRIERDTV